MAPQFLPAPAMIAGRCVYPGGEVRFLPVMAASRDYDDKAHDVLPSNSGGASNCRSAKLYEDE